MSTSTTLDDRYIDSSSWLSSYTAVDDLLSDTLMVSGIKWCPVIDELLYLGLIARVMQRVIAQGEAECNLLHYECY